MTEGAQSAMPSLITVNGQRIELEKNRSYVLGRGQGCEVVVVARPLEQAPANRIFSDIRALVDACVKLEG